MSTRGEQGRSPGDRFKVFLWALVIAGAALIVGALPGAGLLSWPIDVVASGVALIALAVTALTAQLAVVTWREQRLREVEAASWEARRAIYEPIIEETIRAFTRDKALSSDELAKMRAPLASWGSGETIAKFGAWFRASARVSSKNGGRILPEDRPELFHYLWEAIAAGRGDLVDAGQPFGTSTATKEQVLGMFFDDYDHATEGAYTPPV